MQKTFAIQNTPIRIAIQKDGRLTPNSLALLESWGLTVTRKDRQLLVRCPNYPH